MKPQYYDEGIDGLLSFIGLSFVFAFFHVYNSLLHYTDGNASKKRLLASTGTRNGFSPTKKNQCECMVTVTLIMNCFYSVAGSSGSGWVALVYEVQELLFF